MGYESKADAERVAKGLDALEAEQYRLKNRFLELEIEAAERMAAKILVDGEHSGRFQFIGVVNEASVHNLMVRLDSFVVRYPGRPIEILLNSGGGNVLDGLALVDYIKLIQGRGTHIKITGYGLVASMASAILSAASERVLTPRCYLGMHEVSNQVAGSISVQEDGIKFSKALQEDIVELLCERSLLTPTKLKNLWARKDVYLNAGAALKLGLIDHIEEC